MDRDRDILEELIVAKDGRKAVYLSERRSQTDFPVLTCAASGKKTEQFCFPLEQDQ